MTVSERVRAVVAPVVAAEGVELFDLEQAGGVLRVTVDSPVGLDLDAIASITRAVSRALDEHDPITGRYTLEVSSPGLERALRTPEHFTWAVGKQVTIKTISDYDGPRRIAGVLRSADREGIVVATDEPADELGLAYGDIDKARTVFEWGPAPKPGRGSRKPGRRQRVKAS